jgi:hypothetical protein
MKKKENIIDEPELYILPSSNDELKLFIEKNKIDMMENVISKIKFALENKIPIIEVFQFKGSQFVVTISEKEFESNLDNIFISYMKDEIYELCPRITKLQKLLKRKNDEKQTKSSENIPTSNT